MFWDGFENNVGFDDVSGGFGMIWGWFGYGPQKTHNCPNFAQTISPKPETSPEAEALGQLGAAASQYVPKLAERLKDSNSDVIRAALSAGASEFGLSGRSEPDSGGISGRSSSFFVPRNLFRHFSNLSESSQNETLVSPPIKLILRKCQKSSNPIRLSLKLSQNSLLGPLLERFSEFESA